METQVRDATRVPVTQRPQLAPVERLAAVDEMSATLAYEARNPLAAIRAVCRSLIEDTGEDETREWLKTRREPPKPSAVRNDGQELCLQAQGGLDRRSGRGADVGGRMEVEASAGRHQPLSRLAPAKASTSGVGCFGSGRNNDRRPRRDIHGNCPMTTSGRTVVDRQFRSCPKHGQLDNRTDMVFAGHRSHEIILIRTVVNHVSTASCH